VSCVPTVQERIANWIMSTEPVPVDGGGHEPLGALIQDVNRHVEQMAQRLYWEYEPTRGAHPDFWQRLNKWLANVETETRQQYLFRLLPHLFFVGTHEIDSLYRVAFNNQIAVWLINQLNMSLNDPNASDLLKQAVRETWFCPITDSMRINAFYHVNNIEGRDYRPDWRSLYRFGNADKVSEFILANGIKRIVLLEDFVGNGGQIKKAIDWAATKLKSRVPLLVVPLVLCPCGIPFFRGLEEKYDHVRMSTCILLRESGFLTDAPNPGEPPVFTEIRNICTLAVDQMQDGLDAAQLERAEKYIPFGWHKTGALIVLYTNCPNNTLPIVFHSAPHWKPLFPRSARI